MLRSDQLLKAHNSLIKNETQEKKKGEGGAGGEQGKPTYIT